MTMHRPPNRWLKRVDASCYGNHALLTIAALVLCFGLSAAPTDAFAQGRPAVVVASKLDTEAQILGNMIALTLEGSGVPVERRLQLGPTKIVRQALVSGEIDIYPEYTGNSAFFHDMVSDPVWKKSQSAYDTARKLDAEQKLVWLERAPANNTWLIAVRSDLAKSENLATMEDFAALAKRSEKIKLAGSVEFVESPAALPAFETTYGFKLPRDQIVVLPGGDTAVTMRAAAQGVSGVNSAMVYGTDGAISALGLVVMEDKQGAQIVYEPAPVVRAAVLERYPQIAESLGKVFRTLTMTRLQELNAKVSVEGQLPEAVARRYLADEKLLP